MNRERQAEEYLRNYSQEDQDDEWIDREQALLSPLSKQKIKAKLHIHHTQVKERASLGGRTVNQFPLREKGSGQKEKTKKSSLPQIPFPVIGGDDKYQQVSYLQQSNDLLATKMLHIQHKTSRDFHNKFIQKLIDKEITKMKMLDTEREEGRSSHFLQKNHQSQEIIRESFRNYRSVKRLPKCEITTTKAFSHKRRETSIPRLEKRDKKTNFIAIFNHLQ